MTAFMASRSTLKIPSTVSGMRLRLPSSSRCIHPARRSTTAFRPYSSQNSRPDVSPNRGRFRRVLKISAFAICFTSAGFLIATAPAISGIVHLMSAPSDAESLVMYRAPDEAAAKIDETMSQHPISQALRASPGWIESRPHMRYPEQYKKHSLTATTLMGPGRVPVPPLVFTDDKHLVSMTYLSTDLCGHIGMVHGGMLATMMDEGLARCAFTSLPNNIGVTASLKVDFRKPTPAGSFVILKAETIKVDGRKVWVKGQLQLLDDDNKPGTVVVEAEALFVEPRYAKMLPKIFQVAPG